MAVKVLTIIVDTAEQSLDSALSAAINELHSLGHSVKEVRVTDDTGEAKVPLNTIEGVDLPPEPEPAPEPPATTPVTADVTPTPPTEAAIPDPNLPVDVPPDPTSVTPSDTPATQ